MHIHAAAQRGDWESLCFALRRGVSINARDTLECTPLHWALSGVAALKREPKTRLGFVLSLLGQGANLEAADHLGQRPLQAAANIPDPAFIQLLVDRGADVRYVTASGYTPMISAAYQPANQGKLAVFETLVRLGVDIDRETEYGETAVSVCLRFGDFAGLKKLLDLGARPKPLHWAPLHQTVLFGSLDEIESLSKERTLINEKNAVFELSPWHLALQRGDLGVIELLASRGADTAQLSRLGYTPLHLAAAANAVKSVEWLLAQGVDPDAQNDFGDTALHVAAERGCPAAIHVLFSAGANARIENSVQKQPINCASDLGSLVAIAEKGEGDLNHVDGCGDWPLKAAADRGDLSRVEWILQHGGKPDLTSTGDTALHAAVRADALGVVDLLLAAGANPNAQDVDGWTPLFSVQSREMIVKLREAGASVAITDQAGVSPEEWVEDPLLKELLT